MAGKGSPVVGILLIVVGVLLLLGRIGLSALMPYLGIVLIVVGILVLLGKIPGGTLVGAVVLILGILLQVGWLHLSGPVGQLLGLADLIAGIVLIVLGVLKLAGR